MTETAENITDVPVETGFPLPAIEPVDLSVAFNSRGNTPIWDALMAELDREV